MNQSQLASAICFSVVLLCGCDSDRITRLEKQNKELQEQIARQQRVADFDMQAKCARDSQVWFNENWGRADKDTLLLSYTNHYNKSVNRCFILVEYHYSLGKNGSWVNDMTLWDIYENSKHAGFAHHHVILSAKTFESADEVITCNVQGKVCKTQEEFNGLVSSYMNN